MSNDFVPNFRLRLIVLCTEKMDFPILFLSVCSLFPNSQAFLMYCCRPKAVFVARHDEAEM